MSRTARVWSHFDKAMRHADEAFKSADEAFAEAERLHDDLPKNSNAHRNGPHTLQFKATNFTERWRLTRKFIGMSIGILFSGKTSLRFRDRK